MTSNIAKPFYRKRQFWFRAILILLLWWGLVRLCSRPFTSNYQADFSFGRGFRYSRQGDYNNAIINFDEAIRLNPDLAAAYIHRGHSRLALGDPDAAIADYTIAIDQYPEVEQSYLDRGQAYQQIGDQESAIGDYTEAIRLNPYLALAYLYRAESYESLAQEEAALADYESFLRLYGVDDALRQEVEGRIE